MDPVTVIPPQHLPAPPAPASQLAVAVNPNEVYATICSQIIKEQALIIGTLAAEQASQVAGLVVDPQTYACRITADGATVVEGLVNQYRDFFGNAAVEVCKEAASRFTTRLPAGKLPVSLR
jgi:hypothetical protein